MAEGFETYRAFAPEGWEPPGRLELALGLAMRLGDADWWCVIAEEDGAHAGQVALMPAAKHRQAVDDPALAHLVQLFVRPPYWGTGVARDLHAEVVAEARRRGYGEMRLFTPAEHGRARRFYEREGWAPARPPYFEEELGLEIVEYRRPLSGGASSPRGASPPGA